MTEDELRLALVALVADMRATADRWHLDPFVTDDQEGAVRGWVDDLAALLAGPPQE